MEKVKELSTKELDEYGVECEEKLQKEFNDAIDNAINEKSTFEKILNFFNIKL